MAAELPGVQGAVRYGPLSPLRTDIMGPFRFLPMQCSHSVYSMAHTLAGGFTVDGRFIDLTGGTGYIEGDRGSAFPRDYLWVQCNDFAQPCSVMASVAHIPFCGRSFTGCICAVVYRGREYRLATYRGVRIVEASSRRLVPVSYTHLDVYKRQSHSSGPRISALSAFRPPARSPARSRG